MAIDWTKPIQHHSGTEAIVLPERDGEYNVAIAYRMEGPYRWLMLNMSKQDAENYFCNVPTLTTATEQAQPEIDWAGEVQFRSRYLPPEEWRTCKVMAGPIDGAVWIKEPDHEIGCVVYCCHYEFCNKPAEPKRVQAILKLWRSAADDKLLIRAYLKDKATTGASVRRWHEDTEGELLDVIEVDLHNVEGLEGGK